MKRKQGIIRKTAATAALTLTGLAALLFGGCSNDKDSLQLVQDDQGNHVSTSTRQELTESLFEHYGTLTKNKDSHLFQDSVMSAIDTADLQNTKQVQITQTLDFGSLTPVFAKDTYDTGNLTVLLQAAPNSVLYTMNWNFADGMTSRIDANGNLIDLLQENLNIGGKNYCVTTANTQWTGGDADEVQLELMTGKVTAGLYVGDTIMVGVDGIDYEVTLVSTISTGTGYSAKWQVNGALTNNISIGNLDILVNGQSIGTANASSNKATFSLGAQKLSIKDTNVNDDDFSGTVSGNGIFGAFNENTDAKARIKASLSQDGLTMTLDSISYKLLANTQSGKEVLVAPFGRLSDNIDFPGASLIDVGFNGLKANKTDAQGNIVNRAYSSIVFGYAEVPDTQSAYMLEFTNKLGTMINVEILKNEGNGIEKKLVTKEASSETDYNISAASKFVLTSPDDVTHVLQYDACDVSGKKLTFSYPTGSTVEIAYDAVSNSATLLAGGRSFGVKVDTATGNIAVDQNGDGKFTGAEVPIINKHGASITLESVSNILARAYIRTAADRIDGKSVDEVIALDFDTAGKRMNIAMPLNPRMHEGIGQWKGQSRYGVLTTLKDSRDLSMTYPEIQEEPDVVVKERN